MCLALGGIGAIVGLAGSAVSAIGAIQQGNATAAAAEYRAKNNALLAEDALNRGAQEQEAQRRKDAALMSRQRAVMAAGNVSLASGSPLTVLGDTALLGELDAARIGDNSRREEQAYLADAKLANMEADNARTAGAIGAFGTILGGTKDLLASSWYKQGNTTSAFAKA